MLGARIDVIQPQIRYLIAYLLPLPNKKPTTAVVKRDKTSQKCLRLQRTLLIRKGSIKYCLLLLWARLKISCISRICRVWNNVCVHVCKTTNWRFIYIIICNCIYIVVINCGWNNNVAVKIVACWNWNVFTSSSWLDRHGEFVFTIHVRRDPPHSNNPVRSSILWVRVKHYRSADLVSSVKVNLFNMFPCCCCSALAWTRCCLGVWQKDGGRCSGWWLKAVTE